MAENWFQVWIVLKQLRTQSRRLRNLESGRSQAPVYQVFWNATWQINENVSTQIDKFFNQSWGRKDGTAGSKIARSDL